MLHKTERTRQEKNPSVKSMSLLLLVLLNAIVLKLAFIYNTKWYLALFITLPLFLAAVIYGKQKKRTTIAKESSNEKVMHKGNNKSAEIMYQQNNFSLSTESFKYLN